MAGVADPEKRGSIDAARIAVSGWSYGGFMTTWRWATTLTTGKPQSPAPQSLTG
jgi:dipeptidyl aminopeptidase/acylaminoacyl peptidase